MKSKNILITGSSGKLGRSLLSLNFKDKNIFAPSHKELDITHRAQVVHYLDSHKIDAVIHCAAIASVQSCEKDIASAIKVNIIGTSNLVEAALKNPEIRFIYVSTDYVYPCILGPYSEKDSTIPFTVYGWTKLGGECAVKILKNHCVVRTSFFDPRDISFDTAPIDAFYSKIPIMDLAESLFFLLDCTYIGTLNVGQKRASAYEILKKHKPSIKPISVKDMQFNRAPDSSLDISLWTKIRKAERI